MSATTASPRHHPTTSPWRLSSSRARARTTHTGPGPSPYAPENARTVNEFGFTGRYLDKETGLWYFRARYCSGSLGRFVSRDPLGYVDGMSLYAGYYVPNGLDPNGQRTTPLARPTPTPRPTPPRPTLTETQPQQPPRQPATSTPTLGTYEYRQMVNRETEERNAERKRREECPCRKEFPLYELCSYLKQSAGWTDDLVVQGKRVGDAMNRLARHLNESIQDIISTPPERMDSDPTAGIRGQDHLNHYLNQYDSEHFFTSTSNKKCCELDQYGKPRQITLYWYRPWDSKTRIE